MSTLPPAVLLDIEGTVAPISFVHDVLFPFARRALEPFLTTRWDEPAVAEARRRIAVDAGHAEESQALALVAHLHGLMDRDAKSTGLKLLQGLIWADGYASGELRATLFPDVAPWLRRYHAAGGVICIYSSGSVAAQRLLFAHTTDGDLTPLIAGWFDTQVGPKQIRESYAQIARWLERPPSTITFVSDVVAELTAAADAGMAVRLAIRPGNAPVTAHEFQSLGSLDELG